MIDSTNGVVAAPPPAAGETVEPFLFRGPEKPLYGCLHRPVQRPASATGVVLCQPIGPEYVRAHRAMRQLANRLTRVGCTVLRFDGYGCGDSAGDDQQGTLDQWQRDVGAAVDETRVRAQLEEVVVIGLRLGGSLAALAGAERHDIDRLVLWDPVLRGRAYVDELRDRHAKQLEYLQTGPARVASAAAEHNEILGFDFGADLIAGLSAMDLLSIAKAPAPRVLVIQSQAISEVDGLAGRLGSLAARVEHQRIEDHEIWMAAPDTGVVPGKVLNAIVSWVARAER